MNVTDRRTDRTGIANLRHPSGSTGGRSHPESHNRTPHLSAVLTVQRSLHAFQPSCLLYGSLQESYRLHHGTPSTARVHPPACDAPLCPLVVRSSDGNFCAHPPCRRQSVPLSLAYNYPETP